LASRAQTHSPGPGFFETNFANPINILTSQTFGLLQSAADLRILPFAPKYSF
jgi:hypothetical protein